MRIIRFFNDWAYFAFRSQFFWYFMITITIASLIAYGVLSLFEAIISSIHIR